MVLVFARGLLKPVLTRMYFPDEEEANADDHVLSAVDDGPPSSRDPSRTDSSSTCDSRARTRRSSSRSEMFERLFVPAQFAGRSSDRAWLQALLDVERALRPPRRAPV